MKIESLIGETMIHNSFGAGIIREVHENYLEVDFAEKKKQCKFLYPSCFDGYARLENKAKQRRIQADLEAWKQETGALQKEQMRQEYEKTQQEILERKNAAEEKKLRAARRAMEHRMVYQR